MGFLPTVPTGCWCTEQKSYADNTDFGDVSPISHFTEGPCKSSFLPMGPEQLKDSEVFKLS